MRNVVIRQSGEHLYLHLSYRKEATKKKEKKKEAQEVEGTREIACQ
jgi:hypothetical protein